MTQHQPGEPSAAEIASLALRVTAARCLDPECMVEDEPNEDLLEAARGILLCAIKGAPRALKSDITIASYLRSAAEKLSELLDESPVGNSNIVEAIRLLNDLAQDMERRGNGNGNYDDRDEEQGSAVGGVLELIKLIESHVRRILEATASLPSGRDPVIRYPIRVTQDDDALAPIGVCGLTNIKQVPREVTIVLKASEITSRDLLRLAYTLHHELICHAFQAALASGDLPNAHASCHWTEGWMDTLAFDVVCDWARNPVEADTWVRLRGEDAKGELRHCHDVRYTKSTDLKPADVKARRCAREAYRRLAVALVECRIATSEGHAAEIAHRFTLNANTHARADCRRLKRLGSQLRMILLSVARPAETRYAVALACWDFIQHRDFDRLEIEIAALAS